MRTRSMIRVATFAVALVAGATALHAQAPPPPPGGQDPSMPRPGTTSAPLAMPGSSPALKPRIVTTLSGPGVYGMPAFRESAVEITASGTAGFSVSIRSVPDIAMPGGQRLPALVQLVDPPPPAGAAAPAPATTSSGSGGSPSIAGPAVDPRTAQLPRDILTARDQELAPPVTVRKLLVFRGLSRNAVSNPDTFFRWFEMEIQATRPGASPIVRRFAVVLSRDEGPPAIVSASSEAAPGPNNASATDFPPLVEPTGADAELYATKTYRLNWVKLHRKVTLIVSNFSVDGERPSVDFQRFYRLVTEYADGTRYLYPYDNTGVYPTPANARRLQILVPNIRRGGFRVYLESPFGRTALSPAFNFQSNQFVTSLPVASASIVAINVDTPLYVGGFESLLGVAEGSYQYRVLPADPRCGEAYATWDSVSMGPVEIFPIGVAGAKFTRTPAANSLVHSGNMPRLVGSAAGLGQLKAHWVGRMKVYVAECAERRLPR